MDTITYRQLSTLIPFESYDEQRGTNPRIDSLVRALLRINGFYKDHEYNPHNVRAWGIYNEFGLLCISVGSCEQEALDNAADSDAMDSCKVDFDDLDSEQLEQYRNNGCIDDLTFLGNASELFDLQYISMRKLS